MPIESHQKLITVEAVRQWRKQGKKFTCRYDLVDFGAHGTPAYNCIYFVEGEEKILVPESPKSDGTVQERKLALVPGLFNHHKKFGDGTSLLLRPDCTLATVEEREGELVVVRVGRNLAEPRNN